MVYLMMLLRLLTNLRLQNINTFTRELVEELEDGAYWSRIILLGKMRF